MEILLIDKPQDTAWRFSMKDELDLHGYKKIAIMGGTFDPIHYGHLITARAVRERLGIERVVFMPTGNPPHKQGGTVTDAHARYDMTCLAADGEPGFAVSRIETDREGMSYTLDTVNQLSSMCDKKCKIYFIIGADALSEIIDWYRPKELMRLCRIIAVTRPGTKLRELKDRALYLKNNYGAHIRLIEVPAVDISSTDIRNRVFAGMSISFLTPPAVCSYIEKNGLYKPDDGFDDIRKKLYLSLTPKRFLHTRGVAEEAKKLAAVYGCDPDKAYLAGLLHDCAKDLGRQRSAELCKKYSVELDRVLKTQPDLIHSFLGAVLAQKEYGVNDEDIINAIRYHTTGRPDMSVLEKIIYLADFFEPSRKSFDGMERIRSLAYEDTDAAMDFSLNHTIDYNSKKNRLIHPLSLRAAEFYKNKNKGG